MQLQLFNPQMVKQALSMPDLEATLYSNLFDVEESERLFQALAQTIFWSQETITLFGKQHLVPRLVAWYGDRGKVYTYSGITHQPHAWTDTLLAIKARVEAVSQTSFNSVLLNLYRNGQDSMGWHSDDEPELGPNPTIASVSLGGTRRFQLRHRYRKELRTVIDLTDGSLLLMKGPTQHFWQHQIPKTRQVVEPRINLTFRTIV
jgi:alkylated DNA repair dioxygenase AlkB